MWGRLMGWGELHTPNSERQVDAADRLSDAVMAWETHPSTGNAERLIEARKAYERTRGKLA